MLIFKSASGNAKTAANQWIGPFQMPDGERITNLWNDEAGHIWVTTPGGVYRIDADKFLASKPASEQTGTIPQWRKEYQQRLAASNWRCRVLEKTVSHKWDEAVAILDAR